MSRETNFKQQMALTSPKGYSHCRMVTPPVVASSRPWWQDQEQLLTCWDDRVKGQSYTAETGGGGSGAASIRVSCSIPRSYKLQLWDGRCFFNVEKFVVLVVCPRSHRQQQRTTWQTLACVSSSVDKSRHCISILLPTTVCHNMNAPFDSFWVYTVKYCVM